MLLLLQVQGHIARCRCCGGRPSSVFEHQLFVVVRRNPLHVMLRWIPRALVLRLFLAPDDRLQPSVRGESLGEFIVGEGVKLLDPNDGHVIAFELPAPL